MDALRGKQVGTWEGVTRLSNSKITINNQVGKQGFKKMDEAVSAAQDHKGAEVVIKNKDGDFLVYGVNDNSRYDLTKGNIEQAKDYPVTNITGKGSQVDGVQALVTEDSHVYVPPSVHKNKFSGNHFVRSEKYAQQNPTPAGAADRAHFAMKGAGTDEKKLMESMATLKTPEDRQKFQDSYNKKYGNLNEGLNGELSNITGDRRLAEQMLTSKGNMLSEKELNSQIDGANAAYKQKGGKLTDSSSDYSTGRLALHLSTPGDGFENKNIAGANYTGKEFQLLKSIEGQRQQSGKKVSPGDVYKLSLEANGGDKFKAMLTAHNMLRAQARGGESQLNSQVPKGDRAHGSFGYGSNTNFFKENLQEIRGGGDESGAWYHMFGTSTAAMKLGGAASHGLVGFEEFGVSKDVWSDPMEYRMDKMGIAMGQRVSNAN